MIAKKTVFLYFYNRKNLGDDLFVNLLCRRYPSTAFCVRSDETSEKAIRLAKNVSFLQSETWWMKQAKKIRGSLAAKMRNHQEERCIATVYIGGSLFVEYPNWKTLLTWWDYVTDHRNFYVLGANFGPWHTNEYRTEMGKIFGKMKDVCFRDRYSKTLFVDTPTTRYAPDILLGYPMPTVEIKEKQAFISVIDCAAKDEGENQLTSFDKAYTKAIAELTNSLIDQGWKVILSSFCREEGDEEGIKKVLDNIAEPTRVEKVCYDGTNMEAVLRRISESTIIYGTRFHAIILGFAARRPVVPIIYSDKTNHVLEDMRYSGKSFDVRKLDNNVGIKMAKLSSQAEDQRLARIDKLAKESERHFLGLDQLLKKSK